MVRLLATMLAVSVLAGCSSPPSLSPEEAAHPPPVGEPGQWRLVEQHTLGFYAGVQASGGRLMLPQDGYCRLLTMTVSPGSTWLNLTFLSQAVNESEGSFGLLGISARSESWDQWVDHPNAYDAQQSYLDNPKRLSVANPEPGRWDVWTFTTGPAVKALGNLTIELEGRSVAPPSPFNVAMWDSFTQPCED